LAGTFSARTPGDAALALGMEIADLQPLVDSGTLRVLPVSGGGWITSDEAIVRAAQIRSGAMRPPRERPAGRRRGRPAQARTSPQLAATPAAATATRATPRPAAAPAPPPVPVPVRAERRVPTDKRPDVHPNARLDMRAAAARLGVDESTALRLAQQRRLRATRLGRQWVTTEQAVREYLG